MPNAVLSEKPFISSNICLLFCCLFKPHLTKRFVLYYAEFDHQKLFVVVLCKDVLFCFFAFLSTNYKSFAYIHFFASFPFCKVKSFSHEELSLLHYMIQVMLYKEQTLTFFGMLIGMHLQQCANILRTVFQYLFILELKMEVWQDILKQWSNPAAILRSRYLSWSATIVPWSLLKSLSLVNILFSLTFLKLILFLYWSTYGSFSLFSSFFL